MYRILKYFIPYFLVKVNDMILITNYSPVSNDSGYDIEYQESSHQYKHMKHNGASIFWYFVFRDFKDSETNT